MKVMRMTEAWRHQIPQAALVLVLDAVATAQMICRQQQQLMAQPLGFSIRRCQPAMAMLRRMTASSLACRSKHIATQLQLRP
jgi:hypothetical protein